MYKFAILSAAVIGLAATPILACDGKGRGGLPPEVKAEVFAEADADGNGALSVTEFEVFKTAIKRERTERKFAKLDADADGQVTQAELDAARQKHGKNH